LQRSNDAVKEQPVFLAATGAMIDLWRTVTIRKVLRAPVRHPTVHNAIRWQADSPRIIVGKWPDAISVRHYLLAPWIRLLKPAGGATCRRIGGSSREATAGGAGPHPMPTTFKTAVVNYLRATNPVRRTQAESQTTPRKWKQFGGGVPIEKVGRKQIREFLD